MGISSRKMAKNMFYNIKIGLFLWSHHEKAVPLPPISEGAAMSVSPKGETKTAPLPPSTGVTNARKQRRMGAKYEPKPYYMKHVKWIFVVLFIVLVSFVDKDNIFSGHNVGDKAPQFTLTATDRAGQSLSLKELRGEYVLLSFWASYDAASRMQNVLLHKAIAEMPGGVKMVSVSFDKYHSVYSETIRHDKIDPAVSFVELAGERSPLFKQYRLNRGLKNYLLNPDGVIIAKDVQADELAAYVKKEAESQV